jgi:hypothetical protein
MYLVSTNHLSIPNGGGRSWEYRGPEDLASSTAMGAYPIAVLGVVSSAVYICTIAYLSGVILCRVHAGLVASTVLLNLGHAASPPLAPANIPIAAGLWYTKTQATTDTMFMSPNAGIEGAGDDAVIVTVSRLDHPYSPHTG